MWQCHSFFPFVGRLRLMVRVCPLIGQDWSSRCRSNFAHRNSLLSVSYLWPFLSQSMPSFSQFKYEGDFFNYLSTANGAATILCPWQPSTLLMILACCFNCDTVESLLVHEAQWECGCSEVNIKIRCAVCGYACRQFIWLWHNQKDVLYQIRQFSTLLLIGSADSWRQWQMCFVRLEGIQVQPCMC